MEINIKGIRWVGCVFDGSGYGQASRNWIKSLVKLGVPIWIKPISFEKDRPDLKEDGQLMEALARTPREYDVNLVRLSPEVAADPKGDFIDKNVINICSCAWETTKLPDYWTECCNKFDAVFVESDWLVGVFKNSGVKVPVLCTPDGVDMTPYMPKKEVNLKNTYTFYSVQQWIERKNGLGLLKAYYRAFDPRKDNVQLVLKTYMTRVEEKPDQHEKIKFDINELKKSLQYTRDFPPIYLITQKLSNEALIKLHNDCDCYVLLDRGEGFGIPFMEAAAAGNPIIASGFGGSSQFLNEDNAYLVDGQLTPVFGMGWNPFYNGNDQDWFEPNLLTAVEKMRYVYEHKEEAFNQGQKARLYVETRFNSEQIGKRLLEAIAEVIKMKRG